MDLRPERVHPQLHGLPVCEEPHLALLPQLPRASGRLHHHQLTPHLHRMLDCYTPVVGPICRQRSPVAATVIFTETVDVLIRECTFPNKYIYGPQSSQLAEPLSSDPWPKNRPVYSYDLGVFCTPTFSAYENEI